MYTDYIEDENNDSYYSDQGDDNNKEKIKKIIIFVVIFVVALVLVVVLAKSCSNRKEVAKVPENTLTPAVIISKESLALEVGEEKELEVDVVNADGEKIVGWYSEDSSIATISDSGNLTAKVLGMQEGTTTVVVSYRANGNVYSNRCEITVTSKTVSLESIEFVQDSISVKQGGDVLLQVKTSPADAKVDDIKYKSDNPSIATVNESGRVTGVGVGTTTVQVSALDGSFTDTITIKVVENGPTKIDPTSLQIRGLSNGLKVKGTAQIDFTVLPENSTNKTVTWTSTNNNIATVNSDGVVTGVAPGTCTIVGSTSNNVSSRLEVTVESDVVAVESITITSATSLAMNVNGTKLITYKISPDNATNKKVYFTTSDSSVAFANSFGIIAAKKAGTATITITTEDGNKSAFVTVTVTDNKKTSSTVNNYDDDYYDNLGAGSSSSATYLSNDTSSNSSVSCNSSLMTYITHNGENKGAVISSIGFNNAKAFTNMTLTPTITFKEVTDCLDTNRIYYRVYYGTTDTNISTVINGGSGKVKTGSTVQLRNGNGYYKIEVQGVKKNSNTSIKKTYYAIVNNSTNDKVKPIISSISFNKLSSTKININTKVNETGSGIKNIKYCLTSLSSCTPNSTFKSYTTYPKSSIYSVSADISNISLPAYKNICMNATDANDNTSITTCKKIK